MPLLNQRHRRDEIMDQPGLAPAAHRAALRGLRRINLWSGSDRIFWPRLRALAVELQPNPLRVLDVACGGGDILTRLARRAIRADLRFELTGIDRSEVAVAAATETATGLGIRFAVADALAGGWPGEYDAIVSSLFLHHLDDDDAVLLLHRMAAAAKCLILVNDLRRSTGGYALAWVGTRLLSRSPVVHFDGPASVAGAWTTAEVGRLATAAGLAGATVEPRWPFRFLLAWEKS